MFCRNCGQKLGDGGKFCPACGTAVQSSPQQPPAFTQSAAPQPAYRAPNVPPVSQGQTQQQMSPQGPATYGSYTYTPENPANTGLFEQIKRAFKTKPRESRQMDTDFDVFQQNVSAVVGRKQEYYLPQFQAMRVGASCKFNWASFIFGLTHALYRNMWREFLGFFRIPLIFMIIEAGLAVILRISDMWAILIPLIPLAIVSSIWILIAGIQFAGRFNLLYMNHIDDVLQGRLPRLYGVSVKNVWLFIGAVVIIDILQAIALSMP